MLGLFELLEMNKIDINKANKHGTTPLIAACTNNDLVTVTILLKMEGINVIDVRLIRLRPY